MDEFKILNIINPSCVIVVKDLEDTIIYTNTSNPSLYTKRDQEYFYQDGKYYKQDIFLKKDRKIYVYTLATPYVHDTLTGALNRLGLSIHLANLEYPSYVLALCDVDYFKKVNDQYGHQVGDFVLEKIVCMIKKMLDEDSLVARYGGEEFILLLRHSPEDGDYKTLEEIRRKIENYEFTYQEHSFHVTLTIGFTLHRPGTDCITDSIDKADKAMYRGKMQGRNRVVPYITKNL
ncbi:MAG: GGDEF domain-containing protein [Bacilli bacterium]|nr:GGDEF domain-containing protein [Bacilli bacterium]